MKTINHIALWLTAFMMLLFSGCKDENSSDFILDGKCHVRLLFNVVQSVTRTGSQEDDVRRADFLIFKDGKLEKKILNVTSFITSPDGNASFDLSMDTEGVRKVYVVANRDDDSWVEGLEINRTTIDDVLAFRTAVLEKMSNPPFVMYGICDDITFGTTQNSVVCPLYRAVACIDIQSKAEKFNLLSAKLIRAKSASTIFPSGISAESESKDLNVIEAADGNVRLYTYENTAMDSLKATAVEIAGEVEGVPLTYTVFFAQEGKFIPIQRNYQYTIQVNEVKANMLSTTMSVRPWLVGDDITNVVSGNRPTVSVVINPLTGVYTEIDSTFVIEPGGGPIQFDVKSNAECGITFTGDWLKMQMETRASSAIEGHFLVEATENAEETPRMGTISISNKISGLSRTYTLTQKAAESLKDKYMVLAVAGQSNASGYDASPVDAQDAVDPNIFQLSYGRGATPSMSIIPLAADAEDIDDHVNGYERNLKSIHLPLAKELLKRVAPGTKILVISVSSSGTGFKPERPYGIYDSQNMKPVTSPGAAYRWGKESAYCKTLLDRVKYALNLNNSNKFLGFVWCQGEYDRFNADQHYPEFTEMTEHIFSDLNAAGYGSRTNYDTFDKRTWYSFSSTSRFMNWYGGSDASVLFSGYKQWNPDGFIHVPYGVPVNPSDAGGGDSHFGQNTFRKIIAPAVAQCMDDNGALFNGYRPAPDRFIPKKTLAEANKEGGSFSDSDIQGSLVLYVPFDTSLSKQAGSANISATDVSLVPTSGLVDLNGRRQVRQASKFGRNSKIVLSRASSGSQWSVSFLLKRTGSMSEKVQTVMSSGTSSFSSPFIGFRYYDNVQRCANITEFVAEPSHQNQKLQAVPGLLLNADMVRSLDGWIHYAITYNSSNQECVVYMNGEEVQRKFISGGSYTTLSKLVIGYGNSSALPGFEGEMIELFVWSKVLQPTTVKKLFLMGYYGFYK